MADILAISMFAITCIALMGGYNVAFTLSGMSLLFASIGVITGSFEVEFLLSLPGRIYPLITKEILMAVPLFVFMGVMLEKSRIAEDLLEAMGNLFGPLSGGLGISVIFVGALLYLVIAALTAAISTTQEDYQTFQGPIMIMLVIGFYISIFASAAGGDTILRISSFIPFFAPMTAPVAFASGLLSPLEVMLALIVLMISTVIVIFLVTPIYKVAILSYEQTKLFKRLKTYMNKSKHE